MNTSAKTGVRWTVQIILTVAVTYFLFRSLRLSWDEIATVNLGRWRPQPLPLVASVVVLLSVFAYLVVLWRRMVVALGGPPLKLGESFRIFFLANLGRYVPGKVWQLAGLAYLAGKRGVSVPVASSSAVLGQVFSLGAAAALAAVVLISGTKVGYKGALAPWGAALLAVIALVTVIPGSLRLLLRLLFRLSRKGTKAPALGRWFGVRWLGLYLPAWIGYGVAFGLLWSSFAALPAVSWLGAVGGFAGAYFLGYAAIFAPAGVGVREGALAVLLAPWLGGGQAAVLAVVARIWMTAVELLPVIAIAAAKAMGWTNGQMGTLDEES